MSVAVNEPVTSAQVAVASYRVIRPGGMKTLWQRFSGWLLGRIHKRVLQFAPGAVAFFLSQTPIIFASLSVLVRLRVFDLLKQEGPLSVDELARATSVDKEDLLRVLRPAAAIGILQRDWAGRFLLGPVGLQYTSDSANPAAAWTELLDRVMVSRLPQLVDAMKASQPLSKFCDQKTCWELMAETDTCHLHDKACSGWSELVVDEVAKSYDFTRAKTLIDVGGGRGALLSAILKAAPHLQGTVYDRDETKLAAQEMFQRHHVAERAQHRSGNFFEVVPGGADLYTIKHVLHDWDDESVLKILGSIRAALGPGSKLLIVEGCVDHDLGPMETVRAIWDLSQYITTWGKSRTIDDFAKLTHQAGLRLQTVYPTGTIDTLVLECVPA